MGDLKNAKLRRTTRMFLTRVGLSAFLAVPAAMALLLMVSAFTCAMVGPWGSVLEVPPGEPPIEFNKTLVALLNLMLIMGPLVIGWCWSGRILARRSRSDRYVPDDEET